MSAMATPIQRDLLLADEARRAFRSAKAAVDEQKGRLDVDFGAWCRDYDAMAKAWHRWEHATRAVGWDPFIEAPEWRHSETPAATIQRIPAESRLTFADLHADGWRSVEHEAVPDSIRNALLSILGWDEDHSGGVFAWHCSKAPGPMRYALVTWVSDGRGDVRQDIAMQVPICTHEVPLAEGCSVCGVLR